MSAPYSLILHGNIFFFFSPFPLFSFSLLSLTFSFARSFSYFVIPPDLEPLIFGYNLKQSFLRVFVLTAPRGFLAARYPGCPNWGLILTRPPFAERLNPAKY